METHTHTHTPALTDLQGHCLSKGVNPCECESLDSCDTGAEKQNILCWSKSHKGSFY